MSNETFISESILNSIDIALKEVSRLLVDSEREFHELLQLNIHHDIY